MFNTPCSTSSNRLDTTSYRISRLSTKRTIRNQPNSKVCTRHLWISKSQSPISFWPWTSLITPGKWRCHWTRRPKQPSPFRDKVNSMESYAFRGVRSPSLLSLTAVGPTSRHWWGLGAHRQDRTVPPTMGLPSSDPQPDLENPQRRLPPRQHPPITGGHWLCQRHGVQNHSRPHPRPSTM